MTDHTTLPTRAIASAQGPVQVPAIGLGCMSLSSVYGASDDRGLSSTPAATGNNRRNHHDREAELVREVDHLRSLLRQAGIDAEQSLRETEASERRRVRDVTEEYSRTQSARADGDEIRHRLKNTLAVVQSIANATLDPDVAMADAGTAFNSRLEALARAHDILFQSN